jgi:hypothetical protein
MAFCALFHFAPQSIYKHCKFKVLQFDFFMSNKKIFVFASSPEAMDISLRLYDLKHLKEHASRTMDTSP